MVMVDALSAILYSFSALFVILDPILSVPIFTSMTRGLSPAEVNRQALVAVIVAGGLMYSFLLFNFLIFDVLGITLPSFQVAGGILLFILGMQMALGVEIGKSKDQSSSPAGVVIGTPLLCGPGAITTVLLLSRDYGIAIPAVAIGLSLLATWIVLKFSPQIQRLLGDCVTDIMAKVLGMLVASIAIKIIADGAVSLITL
ncbi:MAG: MarC family protein [Methanomicrobiales archaeon]|jgi:multiple antibiotic resistance protein|nr:MarC family protein [Methanomicrobiales archaeon]